jgi:hypothetical protein
VFGNRAAPAQFADLAEMAVLIARTLAKIPRWWVHRPMDDTIVVSPPQTNYTQTFVQTFQATVKVFFQLFLIAYLQQYVVNSSAYYFLVNF